MREQDIIEGVAATDLIVMMAGKEMPAVMTHVSRGKWHMTKVVFSTTTPDCLHLDIPPKDHHHPINIQIDQPVGISFKHDYSKYIFESTIIGFEPSINVDSGGIIVVQTPDRVERVQRRNYYRVSVPEKLTIKVLFWHRGYSDDCKQAPMENYWQGTLMDLSAGGLQIAIDSAMKHSFRQGQLIGMQFTPLPYERPLLLECQLRHIAPSSDGKFTTLGLQTIGLEATVEGRDMLRRLCHVVETYFTINEKAGMLQPIEACVAEI